MDIQREERKGKRKGKRGGRGVLVEVYLYVRYSIANEIVPEN